MSNTSTTFTADNLTFTVGETFRRCGTSYAIESIEISKETRRYREANISTMSPSGAMVWSVRVYRTGGIAITPR